MVAQGDQYLDAGLRGYIYHTARRSARGIAGVDVEDLVQEGYAVYYHCCARYVGVRPMRKSDGTVFRRLPKRPDGEARRHFMGLFKTAFRNRLATLAAKSPASVEVCISSLVSEGKTITEVWELLTPVEQEVATVSTLLATAPVELRQLFSLLVEEALTVSGYRRYGRGRFAKRETNNRRWCRLLGLPTGTDLYAAVAEHFGGNR